MAQVAKGSISIAGSQIVGGTEIDPGTVKGEGGPTDPRLLVPIAIAMNSRPEAEQLALVRLAGRLHLDRPEDPSSRIGFPDVHDLIYNMPCRSVIHGSVPHRVELRFPLTMALVERLEDVRHASRSDEIVLHIHLEGIVVWLRVTHGDSRYRDREVEAGAPFIPAFGPHSEMSLFWLAQVEPLRLALDMSQWVKNVLPGLGYDRVRLLEVSFPPPTPPIGNAARQFDAARSALDSNRYNDSLSATRGVINAWEKHLGAGKKNPVASVMADKLKWTSDDPRRGVLDALWKSLNDFANVPHHPEGQTHPFEASPADARLQVMLTAVVSEYLDALLKPGP